MTRSPGNGLPVIPMAAAPPATEEAIDGVAGILLAAGESTRFGADNKLLATVDGESIVRHAARILLEAGLSPVVVVLGHEASRVRDALSGMDLVFADNPAYRAGQSTSVATGVAALQEPVVDVEAVVIALGDMPAVRVETVRRLVGAFRAGRGDALAAAFEGRRGNPVLFDARFFPDLADLEGDRGARDLLLGSDDSALVETGDPGVLADVDDPADLADRRADR